MIGYKPAVLARLDPRTLRPLPGRRIRLRYGISSYGWSPGRSLLVLGDVDDDVVHLVDPVRMRRLGAGPRDGRHPVRPGDRSRHLLGTQDAVEAQLDGDLLYTAVDTGAEQDGRVVASSAAPLPFLLLGEGGPSC